MTTPPKDDHEALFYADCIRGAAMRAFSLQHLKKYGFLPHLKRDPEDPQLRKWFSQQSPHINAYGSNAPSDHEWSKLVPAPCKLFDEIVDPSALLDDKTIGLPGAEMLTIFKPKHLGVKMDRAKHSRRLLIETLTSKQVEFMQFLRDLAAGEVRCCELLFAIHLFDSSSPHLLFHIGTEYERFDLPRCGGTDHDAERGAAPQKADGARECPETGETSDVESPHFRWILGSGVGIFPTPMPGRRSGC